jgi:hypothetical protein
MLPRRDQAGCRPVERLAAATVAGKIAAAMDASASNLKDTPPVVALRSGER